MTTRKICAALAASVPMALSSASALAQAQIKLEKVASGLNAPLAMVQPPGDPRMFIVEQYGRIRILENGQLKPTPFLDVRRRSRRCSTTSTSAACSALPSTRSSRRTASST